jgi:multimeric flavodoxin WrbA
VIIKQWSKGENKMKIIAVNGSPRKNWNTHILLTKALEGAQEAGAQTELINLYDLEYKGCQSCLACKVKTGTRERRCVVTDGLLPVLDQIHSCDGFILGSPIYLGDVTAMMRALWERLIFQYLSYDDYAKRLFERKIKTAFIYTMNVPEAALSEFGYDRVFQSYDQMLRRCFGSAEYMISTETLQVTDYNKYHMASFNEEERKKRREEIFPTDCEKAYQLGKSLAN